MGDIASCLQRPLRSVERPHTAISRPPRPDARDESTGGCHFQRDAARAVTRSSDHRTSAIAASRANPRRQLDPVSPTARLTRGQRTQPPPRPQNVPAGAESGPAQPPDHPMLPMHQATLASPVESQRHHANFPLPQVREVPPTRDNRWSEAGDAAASGQRWPRMTG